MNEKIEREMLRLVKEIADDERSLMRAESWEIPDKVKRYENSINRKLEVLKTLKDKA